MNKYLALLLILFTFDIHSEINNYQTLGNLESLNPANCTSIDKIKNSQNPADIFQGARKCILLEEYDDAAILYLVAMTYALYDTERVRDKSAHQAISALRSRAFNLQKYKLDLFKNSINSTLKSNVNFCSELKKLGKPNYHPSYMIQHGMRAFSGKQENNGIVNDFSPDTAWSKSIERAAKCTTNFANSISQKSATTNNDINNHTFLIKLKYSINDKNININDSINCKNNGVIEDWRGIHIDWKQTLGSSNEYILLKRLNNQEYIFFIAGSCKELLSHQDINTIYRVLIKEKSVGSWLRTGIIKEKELLNKYKIKIKNYQIEKALTKRSSGTNNP